MAASKKVGGFVCEFIDPVSEDYFVCNECKHVAREPHTTSCCGETFCQVCIENKKPCPSCGEEEFTTTIQAKFRQKILTLRAYCSMKDRGCGWTGKLEGLDAHLDVDTGDCQYVDVPCPDCDQQVQKRELATHLADVCPKRDYNCRYCGFSGTYEVVCDDHWPECEQYPIPCPNYCGLAAIERCTLEDHLKLCSMQEVECDFTHAGCTEKFLRQDLEKHMEENTQKHLVLISAATLRISQEFEKKTITLQEEQQQKHEEQQHQLHQQHEEFQELLRQKEQEIGELRQPLQEKDEEFHRQLQEKDQQTRDEIRGIHEQLRQKEQQTRDEVRGIQEQLQRKEQQIQEAEARITELQRDLQQKQTQIDAIARSAITVPLHFTMPDFDQLKRGDNYWDSPSFYTHPCGYKLLIKVYPNGNDALKGDYVTALLYTVNGEFDDQLQWPRKCTITLQFLNQHRHRDHLTYTRTHNIELCRGGNYQYLGYLMTVAHVGLGWNAQKQTQYLKDDCLQFQVTKMELK